MVSDDSYGTLHLFAIEVRLEVIGKKAKNATFISGTEATKISKEIQKVEKRRIVKSTLFNERSSRSHCMMIIDVPTVEGRLILINMAGFENIEQAGQTGIEAKMQVFIQYMPHTRSSGQPLLPINLEPQRIGRMEAQHKIERMAAQQFRNECRPVQPAFNDDDDDLDGARDTGAIIPLPLAAEAKFNIISTMIQLLQLKGLFGGLACDDLNMHLINFISICKSFDNPGVGQNAIRLRLFPLSLSGEATLWLNGLTPNSITNWRQLKDAFLERFFPPSKRAQLRDEISNFRQLPTEALYETWERFKTKLMRCPNHHMTNVHLMEILYRSLNSITKPVVDNMAGGSFMNLTFGQASNMLDRIMKQSKAWHTRDSEVAIPTLPIGITADQRRREEEPDQDMTHLKTQVDLLTKHLL
ncbi:hypothetical protein CQW23_30970 [Capsicum baccatum]|uniref:Uncharacterized protein n=1 Tax=Capsicum baccatum TaxID=33114 RepID=A0A2G2V8X4_CAPBA|nr:hypothetical protein CQW23_30970 [Capsicum baccatum]